MCDGIRGPRIVVQIFGTSRFTCKEVIEPIQVCDIKLSEMGFQRGAK